MMYNNVRKKSISLSLHLFISDYKLSDLFVNDACVLMESERVIKWKVHVGVKYFFMNCVYSYIRVQQKLKNENENMLLISKRFLK